MRRVVAGLLALGLALPAAALEPGTLFPTVGGEPLPAAAAPIGPSQLRGKVVYVDVWASWCPPCRVSLPILQTWQERYAPRGFSVFGINVDRDKTAALRALTAAGATYPGVREVPGETLEALGVRIMPQAFLLDRDGRVRYVHHGFSLDERAALEREIETLLGPD